MAETEKDGTTIHWHGMHQRGTPEMDGVPWVTQPPIMPGEANLYNFKVRIYAHAYHYSYKMYLNLFPIIWSSYL